MKKYKVKIELDALEDIQQITNWYNNQQKELGKRFQSTAIKQIDTLSKYAHSHAIRYQEFRCMVIKKFPYMVHYYINEETNLVEVFAIIGTSRDPKIWKR